MMLHSELHGRHILSNFEGITLDELLQFLKSVPRKARSNYLTIDGKDVIGIAFGQSDQAEHWEFRVHIITDGNQ